MGEVGAHVLDVLDETDGDDVARVVGVSGRWWALAGAPRAPEGIQSAQREHL